ncbi:MAG: glycosyltransferase family 9 protein [Verrucomicrobiales bacterium]|nr:hypothetical protein [Verrucomicrobiae bacterium]
MRRLTLHNSLSPGDIVMLTAAVRDLHRSHPGQFITDVRTPCGQLWENNPYITKLDDKGPEGETIECHYPLIQHSNQLPFHFIHGFIKFLSERLNVPVTPTEFRGDIYLSDEEKGWMSQVEEITGSKAPFWIIVAGGKRDFTIKWWSHERFQAVVDHFQGKIRFVQVGETGHHHLPLRNVIDLRGKTDIRQLVRLVYHAQGVLCPVTFLMHLAPAVPTMPGAPKSRPCVVVAGGREPVHWEAYSGHRFLHTQGSLPCCETGGCWKARTVPLGDGDEKDRRQNLCLRVTPQGLPKCMDMITAGDVIRAVESYFEGGLIRYLEPDEQRKERGIRPVHIRTNDMRREAKETAEASATSAPEQETLEVCGLRRSGLHPIMNWLLSHFEGDVTFINDLGNKEQPLSRATESDRLPCLDEKRRRSRLLGEPRGRALLMIGFEDTTLEIVRDWPTIEPITGAWTRKRRVLILRDPFNLFASRLHLARQRPHVKLSQGLFQRGAEGTRRLLDLWKTHAREFLGHTHVLGEETIRINYNRWNTEVGYRKTVSEQLGRPFHDREKETVPPFGYGSSFDGMRCDQNASRMKVFARWEELQDDTDYRALLADGELWELATEIFGETISPVVHSDLAVVNSGLRD